MIDLQIINVIPKYDKKCMHLLEHIRVIFSLITISELTSYERIVHAFINKCCLILRTMQCFFNSAYSAILNYLDDNNITVTDICALACLCVTY
jgi:hypothetical protein